MSELTRFPPSSNNLALSPEGTALNYFGFFLIRCQGLDYIGAFSMTVE